MVMLSLTLTSQNDIPVVMDRPVDFEYLSSPDSLGNRRLIKAPCMPLIQKGKVNYTDYFSSIYPKFNLVNDTSFTLKVINDSVLVME
jgi:hypothetical protein